ncbi:YusG family protein [Cytobacillus firmus]|uniref:YusG family protein n=1 Tax=Cytobacillus firmus TaxID=1399 RepID=UPI0022282421|nr:YusG family protein [Cytobacillus firmus]
MTLNQQKIDITDRVVGKLKNNGIDLYLENEKIGQISLPEGSSFNLSHHFETDHQKIYQNVSVPDKAQERYTDCDEGGWC